MRRPKIFLKWASCCRASILGGAATCSVGFVICFFKFPLLAWAAWQLQYRLTAWKIFKKSKKKLRNKWPPHPVYV